DRARLRNHFAVVGGGSYPQSAAQFASPRRIYVGCDQVRGFEDLPAEQAAGERFGHVAAADETELLHVAISSRPGSGASARAADTLSEDRPPNAHDSGAFRDRDLEVTGHSHRKLA